MYKSLRKIQELLASLIPTNTSGQTVQDALDDLETDSHTHTNKAELDLVTDGDHDVRTDNPHNVDSTQIPTTTSGETVQDALNATSGASHTQGTDQKLDDGGANETSALEIRSHIDDTSTNPHDVIASLIPTNTSGETVQDALDALDTDSHTHANKAQLDLVSDGDHDVRTDNPHGVDKTDVGLGSVPNLDTTDAVNNQHVQNSDTKLDDGQVNEVTSADLRSHLDDQSTNPHDVVANQVGTDDSGVTVQDALDALETDQHTHANKAELDLITDGDHDVRTDNPHNVTSDQVPTDTSGQTVQDALDALDADSHTHSNKVELDLITDGDHDVRTDNPHNVTADQISTNNSGETVQDALDSVTGSSHTQNTDQKLDNGGINETSALEIRTHIDDVTTNPHSVTKTQVGLGNVDNTTDANKPVSTAQQTALNLKINNTEKGSPNGVATLDGAGKVPTTQLPDSILGQLFYNGVWDANTNTPTLADSGVGGSMGDYYVVNVVGTTSIDGNADWQLGDWIVNNGVTWDKIDNSDKVSSVNGQSGAVSLDTDDITEGSTNLYYTETRVSANTDVSANTTDRHTHANKAQLDLVTDGDHDVRTDNPHAVTKSQVGLGNVPNVDSTNASNISSGTLAEARLTANTQDAIAKRHTQGTDLGLDTGGLNPVTALQIKTHIDNITTNPHAVTKTQVGLGNVTNDAQLKRADGDFNSFTGKTTPVDGDIVLIEDSASTFTKKKLTWANIKATLKTYFDTLYNLYVHPNHTGEVTSVADGAQTLNKVAISNKSLVTPEGTDNILIGDTSDTDNLKKVTVQSIVSLAGASGGKDLNFSFGDHQGVGIMLNGNGAYISTSYFLFRGTTALGTPTNIKAIVDVGSVADLGSVRILNVNSALNIATVTGLINTATAIVDLGAISNLPASPAIFAIQVKAENIKGSTITIHAISVQF